MMPRGLKATTSETAAEIIRLYRHEGLSIRGVHDKTGVSAGVIARLIREAGVSRPVGRPSVPPEVAAAITAACADGLTPEQAAVRYGVGVAAAKNVVRFQPRVPGILTGPEAVALLGVDTPTMNVMARAGLVRFRQASPGARRQYVAADVAELVALRTQLAAQQAAEEKPEEAR
jgi:hypothetical protein